MFLFIQETHLLLSLALTLMTIPEALPMSSSDQNALAVTLETPNDRIEFFFLNVHNALNVSKKVFQNE